MLSIFKALPYRNFSSAHSYLTKSDEALRAENLYVCVWKLILLNKKEK